MVRNIVCAAAVATIAISASASAQDHRGEVGVTVGWTFGDGVDGQNVLALDGNVYNRIDPKDSFKWGFNAGYYLGEHEEIGFAFSQAPTQLEVSGTATKTIGDMKINNYHGYFGYNFGETDSMIRPFFTAGFGATNFGGVSYTRSNGQASTTASSTKFSTSWGAGVKVFPSPNFGIRLGAQWTPTYIKTDEGGWWCDPWWGCYVVGNAKYANQFDLVGGVTFRF